MNSVVTPNVTEAIFDKFIHSFIHYSA
jgi:hypothetical protein